MTTNSQDLVLSQVLCKVKRLMQNINEITSEIIPITQQSIKQYAFPCQAGRSNLTALLDMGKRIVLYFAELSE